MMPQFTASMLAWSVFGVCAVLIAIAGSTLCRDADIIAEKLNLGRNWVGLVLLATVTSLPEFANGISSVTIARTPEIAVGDIFGSCVFNLLLLVLVDFLYRETPVFRTVSQGHLLTAGFGIVMIAFAGLSVTLNNVDLAFSIWHVGLSTPILIGLYLLSARTLFVYERARDVSPGSALLYARHDLGRSVRRALMAAVVVATAGIALPFSGAAIAAGMGWEEGFVGTLFIALATSLPEIAITVTAVRLRAPDLAFANLLGSNLFNLAILAVDDIFYTRGPLLHDISAAHIGTALTAVLMTGVVVIGLVFGPERRLFRTLNWISLALVTIYVFNVAIISRYAG